MTKGEIIEAIDNALAHLQQRNDPFGEVKADCEIIQRAVRELRKLDSSKAQQIEQLQAEVKLNSENNQKLRQEIVAANQKVKDADVAIAKMRATASSSAALAKKIMLFHDSFKMESLEKKMGDDYAALKKTSVKIAKEVHQSFIRKGRISKEDVLELFFRQMEAVQKCASDREDKIYEACRQTIINFSIYLAAAIAKFGPIEVDENTDVREMEFVVEGEPPVKFTVREKTQQESAQEQANEYRNRMKQMMEGVKGFINQGEEKEEDE